MAKAKSRTKSKLQPTANADTQSTKRKSKFALNAEHKRFLDEHADKHAVPLQKKSQRSSNMQQKSCYASTLSLEKKILLRPRR